MLLLLIVRLKPSAVTVWYGDNNAISVLAIVAP